MNKVFFVLSVCLLTMVLIQCSPGPSVPKFSEIEAGLARVFGISFQQ